MAPKESACCLAVLALVCFHVALVTSQSCDPDLCYSIALCGKANNAMLKFTDYFKTSLSSTAYSYLKTNMTNNNDTVPSLLTFWSTFSLFNAKLEAYKLTASYKTYISSTAQRDNATFYKGNLTGILREIKASLPIIPTAAATNETIKQMTDLYAETAFVSGKFKAFLLSWDSLESCSGCMERKRRNSKGAKKSAKGRGKKEKKFTTKKANRVIKARKEKGKNKGKGKGAKNKKQ